MKNQVLALPGPTPVCPEALQQMSSPMFNHRGPRFTELYWRVVKMSQELFQTTEDIYVLTCSGTGAMEAAVVNTLSAGDRVLAVVNGAFGQRYADIAESYGANVSHYQGPWGQAAEVDQLEALMKKEKFAAILAVHCETSTAVLNPIKEITRLRDKHQPEALMIVDAISSLGANHLPVDQWGLDVVVTGSQKVLAAPPGLALLSFSQRAWQAYEKAKMPKYYWDLGKYKKFNEIGQTPFTPAISQFLALEVACGRFIQEGLENSIARHQKVTDIIRSGIRELGLKLLCDDSSAATTVTAAYPPEGIDVKAFTGHLREQYNLVVAGGQGKLAGQIFRVGHLGLVDEATAAGYLYLLKQGLDDLVR